MDSNKLIPREQSSGTAASSRSLEVVKAGWVQPWLWYLQHASGSGVRNEILLTLAGNVCLGPLLRGCGAFTYKHTHITKLASHLGVINPVGGSPRREAQECQSRRMRTFSWLWGRSHRISVIGSACLCFTGVSGCYPSLGIHKSTLTREQLWQVYVMCSPLGWLNKWGSCFWRP